MRAFGLWQMHLRTKAREVTVRTGIPTRTRYEAGGPLPCMHVAGYRYTFTFRRCHTRTRSTSISCGKAVPDGSPAHESFPLPDRWPSPISLSRTRYLRRRGWHQRRRVVHPAKVLDTVDVSDEEARLPQARRSRESAHEVFVRAVRLLMFSIVHSTPRCVPLPNGRPPGISTRSISPTQSSPPLRTFGNQNAGHIPRLFLPPGDALTRASK